MGRLSIALCVAGLLAVPAAANDSTAEMRAGGLELVRTDAVRMASEDLFISAEQVRVTYIYHNVIDEDVETLVAFPMPEFAALPDEDVAIPNPGSPNFLDFDVWVDGQLVEPELHQRATAYGIDVTNELTKLHIPLESYQGATYDALAHLGIAVLEDMETRGLILLERQPDAEAAKYIAKPNWHLHSTFAWRMVFPAHSEVRVDHQYTPSVGASSGLNYYDYQTNRYEPEYIAKYCIDPPFEAAVQRRMTRTGDEFVYMWEQRLSYILMTANNWAGEIGRFHLTVDKGSETSLVSFCAVGLEKTGPTTFEMTAENYYPQRDLDILFIRQGE